MPLYVLGRVLEALFYIRLFKPDSRFYSRSVASEKKRQKPTVPFYRRVFNFVLGPERDNDPLTAQRRFTAFVRAHEGTVSAADWAAYSGSSFEAAENALTAAALRFRAKVDLTHDGALLYRFDELVLSASVRALEYRQRAEKLGATEALVPMWDRPASSAPLTGNSFGWNLWISTLNVFNVLMGVGVLSAQVPIVATIALGYMPIAFGLFFFGVPIVRLLARAFHLRSRALEDERRNLMKEVFARAMAGEAAVPLPPADQTGGRQARRRRRRMVAVLPRVVADLEGEPAIGVTVGDTGLYRFDRLAEHLLAAAKARGVKKAGLRFGATIFSSEDDSRRWDKRDRADFDRRLARELTGPTDG